MFFLAVFYGLYERMDDRRFTEAGGMHMCNVVWNLSEW